MSGNILDIVKYTSDNFSVILNVAVIVLISAYFFYGLLLAVDASKRYRSSWAPVIVFIGWLFLSVVFVPIYLIIRPDYGAAERVEASKTDVALLMSSGLYLCDDCESVVEKIHKYCLNCGRSLIVKCINCKHQVQRSWKMCPECGQAINKPKVSKSVFGGVEKLNVNSTSASVVTDVKPSVAEMRAVVQEPSVAQVTGALPSKRQEEPKVRTAEKLNTAQEI